MQCGSGRARRGELARHHDAERGGAETSLSSLGSVLRGSRTRSSPSAFGTARSRRGSRRPRRSRCGGYRRTYTVDFGGRTLPTGWGTFNGIPQGDNQSRWLPSHVVVSGGLVRLIASKDASGQWVTGGISQYSVHRAYGAYFVRSRVTGPGPDQNEMLWPVAPVWPPEVDFNEMGNSTTSTSWTVHYGHGSAFVQNDPELQHGALAHVGAHLDADVDDVHDRRPARGACCGTTP